jgi:endonuclease YncB( thermonuclease family)
MNCFHYIFFLPFFFKRFNYNNINKKQIDPIIEEYSVLKDIKDDKDVPYFSLKGMTFYAMPCHIYDGDTFDVIFRYKEELIKFRCRALGYDCPEMKPLLSNPNRIHEKELAILSKNKLLELLYKHPTKLIKIECFHFDKYGRLLIKMWNMVDEKSINEIMIEDGYAKPYDGGKKNTNW